MHVAPNGPDGSIADDLGELQFVVPRSRTATVCPTRGSVMEELSSFARSGSRDQRDDPGDVEIAGGAPALQAGGHRGAELLVEVERLLGETLAPA